jgi:hypothetical protein
MMKFGLIEAPSAKFTSGLFFLLATLNLALGG